MKVFSKQFISLVSHYLEENLDFFTYLFEFVFRKYKIPLIHISEIKNENLPLATLFYSKELSFSMRKLLPDWQMTRSAAAR